jgi:hypothetical protein
MYRKRTGERIECKSCLQTKSAVGSKKGVCKECHTSRWEAGRAKKAELAGAAKVCCVCKETKPNEEFRVEGPVELYSSRCLECAKGFRYLLLKESDRQLLYSMSDHCHICGVALTPEEKRIDHCHDTMAVRGILCSEHNVGLGKFGESIEMLESALAYLKKGAWTKEKADP